MLLTTCVICVWVSASANDQKGKRRSRARRLKCLFLSGQPVFGYYMHRLNASQPLGLFVTSIHGNIWQWYANANNRSKKGNHCQLCLKLFKLNDSAHMQRSFWRRNLTTQTNGMADSLRYIFCWLTLSINQLKIAHWQILPQEKRDLYWLSAMLEIIFIFVPNSGFSQQLMNHKIRHKCASWHLAN